jgi:hypothetical protein
MRVLARKSSGLDVYQLQRALQMEERFVDGIFGSQTEDVVRKFQKANGIREDGVVGENTLQALEKAMRGRGKTYDRKLSSGLVLYEVPLIPQPNDDSCWAAAMAMVVSYARKTSYSPQDIADAAVMNLNSSYGWEILLIAADYWRLRSLPMTSNTPEIWIDYLKRFGPVWTVRTGDPSHGVVLTGGDGGWFHINDPWPPKHGHREVKTFRQLGKVYEGAERQVIDNLQLLYHLPT